MLLIMELFAYTKKSYQDKLLERLVPLGSPSQRQGCQGSRITPPPFFVAYIVYLL